MKAWIVDNGYHIDFNEAPAWATQVAWRREGHPLDGTLHRVWVDNNHTKYQYLRGFGLLKDFGKVFRGNFFALDYHNPAKICAYLDAGAAVTTSRNDIDYVVTEYDIASLKGKTLRQRAAALIHIAHPDFRPSLIEEFEKRHKDLERKHIELIRKIKEKAGKK